MTHRRCDSLVSVFIFRGFINPLMHTDISLLPWMCREGGALPDGTVVLSERLVFQRPLRLNDSGVYGCTAKNSVGTGKAEYLMSIGGECKVFSCFGFVS